MCPRSRIRFPSRLTGARRAGKDPPNVVKLSVAKLSLAKGSNIEKLSILLISADSQFNIFKISEDSKTREGSLADTTASKAEDEKYLEDLVAQYAFHTALLFSCAVFVLNLLGVPTHAHLRTQALKDDTAMDNDAAEAQKESFGTYR